MNEHRMVTRPWIRIAIPLLLLSSVSVSNANTEYEHSLTWSSDLCDDLGYDFDYCAELEFCEGGDDDDLNYLVRGRRRLRGHLVAKTETSSYEEPDNFEEDEFPLYGSSSRESMTMMMRSSFEEVDSATSLHERSSSSSFHPAQYGWRVKGDADCVWPGPLIRMERGVSYGLLVSNPTTTNNEQRVTNLHTHGLHVAGHGNADDSTRRIGGGDVVVYNYTIPDDHMGGTHWYHSHAHPHTQAQVNGGAFGVLVVEDGADVMRDVTGDDPGVRAFLDNERILVLSNNNDNPHKNKQWLATTYDNNDNDNDNNDNNLFLHTNEWYRLRTLTVNTDPYADSETLSFDPEHCDVYAIAHDGVLRFEVPAKEPKFDHQLTLSSRLDVAIKCRSGPSDVKVNGVAVTNIMVEEVMLLEDDAAIVPSPYTDRNRPWSSKRPPYLADLRNVTVDHRWTVKMDETNINRQTYSATQPLCDKKGRDFVYDSVQEWTVKTMGSHPVHLHGYHLQTVDDCDLGHDTGEYYDTINSGGSCQVRVRLIDVAGRTTLHCHVYRHGDTGSMGFVNIVGEGAPVQPSEPRVHECGDTNTGNDCDEVVVAAACPGLDEDADDEDDDDRYNYDDDDF